jgi:hypothetical protein
MYNVSPSLGNEKGKHVQGIVHMPRTPTPLLSCGFFRGVSQSGSAILWQDSFFSGMTRPVEINSQTR